MSPAPAVFHPLLRRCHTAGARGGPQDARPGAGVSVVSSCDVYEFSGGLLTTLTSYAVELDPAAVADRA